MGSTAVIVVNYAASELIAANLPTGVVQEAGARVIVVDNYSGPDESAAVNALCTTRGWTLASSANQGFGAGVNRGAAVAGELGCTELLILNPDVVIDAATIAALGAAVAAAPRTLVCPRLTEPGGGPHFNGFLLELATGRTRRGWPGDSAQVGWLTAACLAISLAAFDELGGFDEGYFMYWEDVELSWRARVAGMGLTVRDDLVAIHAEGGTQDRSGRAKSDLYYRYNARNRLRFAVRNLPPVLLRRWLWATWQQTNQIWLRGGRRQLLHHPAGLLAAWGGALDGTLRALRWCWGSGSASRGLPGAEPGAPVTDHMAVAATDLPEIVVAVLTFRREDQIVALIPLLAAQLAAAAGRCRARLVVVDNDPAGGAAAGVRRALAAVGLTDGYVHEPCPGLVAARNRALAEAGQADALVFIDDDERPCSGWLTALVDTWLTTGAWAVTGPVRSEFARPPSDWVVGSALFERVRAVTGSERVSAATNNLLLDLHRLRAAGLRFDERFAATGGEDSFLMKSLRKAGGTIRWCDRAEVSELVPPSRINRPWVLRRAMRQGETWAWVRVMLTSPGWRRLARRVECLLRGVRILGCRIPAVFGARLRGDERARGAHEAAAAGGLGVLRGALGLRYREYQRRDG